MTKKPSVRSNILRWIKALRSGKYRQATGYLYDEGRYCCLGVALVVGGARCRRGVLSGNSELSASLNEDNGKRFGLTRASAMNLAVMNDDGVSFKEIASHIKKRILPRHPAKRRSRPSRVRSGGR